MAISFIATTRSFVFDPSLFMGLPQFMVNHKTLATSRLVEHHVKFSTICIVLGFQGLA